MKTELEACKTYRCEEPTMKIITLSEAYRKATKGPLAVSGVTMIWSPNAKANVASASSLRATDSVKYAEAGCGDKDLNEIATNAALLAHCFNHFQEVVEAANAFLTLSEMHDLYGTKAARENKEASLQTLERALARADKVEMP